MPGSVALRPQLLAVPLFLTSVEILRRRGEGTHVLAWLPLVTVVWANLHGSFLLAPLLCGIALVGDIARRRDVRSLALVTLACLLAAAVNPWGFAVYGYVFQLATATIVRTVIDEWQPLWRQFPAWPLVLLAGSFVGLMFATGRLRRPLFEEGLGLMTFGALAIASGRNLLWACLYAPPVLSGLILRKRERMPERSVIGVALVGTLVALVAIGIGRVATADPDESLLSEAPIGITEALGGASSSGGRVFDGWWGSWFEFALPHQQMFVDARAELFPDRVWNDFFAISTATGGWQHALDRWDIRIVVASYDHQERLITAIAADPGWLEIYRDQDGVIFRRVHDA